MSDFSTEDRQAICETFERLLADKCDEARLREVIETESGFDDALWAQMAELGLTGLMIAPEQGGIGGTIEEAEAALEIAGAYLYNGPYISTCVMAPMLLSACTDETLAAPHLQNIAEGKSIIAIAGCAPSGDWTAELNATANAKNELSGEAGFVVHAGNADHCLVYANSGEDVAVYLVKTGGEGVTLTPHKTDDLTLRLSSMTFKNAPVQKLEGVGAKHIQTALQIALVAQAGDQVGATRRIFNLTIEYLNTRFQFGQPIGRFQALKHMAADLLIEVENASSAARHAARAVAAQAPTSNVLTYLAAFTCADNFRTVAAAAIQLHGGIAYTMEHPAHLYWRRAQTGQWLFGSSDRFRDLYLSQMEKTL